MIFKRIIAVRRDRDHFPHLFFAKLREVGTGDLLKIGLVSKPENALTTAALLFA